MKKPRPILRLVVLLTSGSLLAAFVAYRAGALDTFIGTRAHLQQPVDSPVTVTDSTAVPELLPGSKSGLLFEPENTTDTEPADSPRQSELWKSSKSVAPVFEPKDIPVVAPSSKSAPVWTPKDHEAIQKSSTTSDSAR
jgi:hypothetical protein